MTLFRPHRVGITYKEAMKTCVEVKDKKELKKLIGKEVIVDPYVFDARNGWNTHIVRYLHQNKYYVAGFLSGGLS